MKPLFLLAISAAGLMTTACSNEDSPLESSSEVPVSLFVEGVNSTSRSTTTDKFVTTFAAQDKIGIFSTGLKADMSNAEFTYESGDAALTGPTSYKFKENTSADFYAYFPYSESASTKEVAFTTVADQTDATKFNACDFMTAKQTIAGDAIGNGAVTLSFKHQMAFVELTFGTTLNTKVTAVEMMLPQNTVTLNATAQTTSTSGDAVTIKMYPQTTGQKYWAIVAPQAFTPSTDALFKITTSENKTYSYKPESVQTFTANNIHKYKLDIKDNSTVFSVSSVTITAWDGSGQTVDGDVTEDKFKQTAPIGTNLLIQVGNRSALTNNTPWGYDKVGITECQAINSEIRFKSVMTDWYKGLYYYGGSTALLDPAKKYKITFKARSAVETAGIQIVVATKDKYLENDNFYLIGTGEESQDVTMQSVTIGTDDFMTKTIYVDASKYAIAVQTPQKVQNTTPRDFVVCFQAKASNTDYYIKDLVIEEL